MDNKISIIFIVLSLLFLGVSTSVLEASDVEEADDFIEEEANDLLKRYKEAFNQQDMDLMKGIGIDDFYTKTIDFFHYSSEIDEVKIDNFKLKDYKRVAEDKLEFVLEYQGVLKLSGSHRDIKGDFSLTMKQIDDFYLAIDTDLYQILELNWERELNLVICEEAVSP